MPLPSPRAIELLAPAANAEVAVDAILHGADAVYIGGPGHGARRAAANSVDDIARVADFAHIYGARVYVTVNTVVYDSELRAVERMVRDLWRAGADALIVQDMALLRLDIPPIELHASTQCDIRTPEKARFLQESGFSQLVLARELTLPEISDICGAVDIPVETFVHGALCVSYSGRCHASQYFRGRSANRGECAQLCRLPYTLRDASGCVLKTDSHLLSLRDFNATPRLAEMLRAGVSSFKIEGRLKENAYVRNITAWYRRLIDREIEQHPDLYRRASFGRSEISFEPRPDKSFNRGFTTYFLDGRRPASIASLRTPKSMGEEIEDISQLNRGDGISFFDAEGNYTGVVVNGVEGGRIIGNRPFRLPKGAVIHRTSDIEWQKRMTLPATRRLRLDIALDRNGISATDETGAYVRIPLGFIPEESRKPMDFRQPFEKLGNTPFRLGEFRCSLGSSDFIPVSHLTARRRELVERLLAAKRTSWHFPLRRPENVGFPCFAKTLDFRDNVANSVAAGFYRDHGVEEIESSMESTMKEGRRPACGTRVMTTRHCILRELGLCLRGREGKKIKTPLSIESGDIRFTLEFDCARCEMHCLAKR